MRNRYENPAIFYLLCQIIKEIWEATFFTEFILKNTAIFFNKTVTYIDI